MPIGDNSRFAPRALQYLEGPGRAVGLGLGFVSIYVIERLYRHRAHWWPLIPGVVLVGSGVGARFGDVGHLLWRFAPAVLVVLGVALVVRAIQRKPGVPTGPA